MWAVRTSASSTASRRPWRTGTRSRSSPRWPEAPEFLHHAPDCARPRQGHVAPVPAHEAGHVGVELLGRREDPLAGFERALPPEREHALLRGERLLEAGREAVAV